MSQETLAHFVLLPDLKLSRFAPSGVNYTRIEAKKASAFEVCPRCATKCHATYDRRTTTVKDAPLRNKSVSLSITKRRLWCPSCKKPFTEPVQGISKYKRYTQRYKSELLWCCEKFTDLKAVKRHLDCSYGFIYRALYEMLELRKRKHTYPWTSRIGIDEHSFKRNRQKGFTEFVSLIVDHNNKRPFELVEGRTELDLITALNHIPGRENVRLASMDLSDTYRRFVKRHFPNAEIVADKFHVIRLLHPAINRYRIAITGDRRKLPVRRLLLKSAHKLDFFTRSAIWKWLEKFPDLREIYEYKEAMHRFYRIKGHDKARKVLKHLLDKMGYSRLPEIQTLRKTLMSWKEEILRYFATGLTNARVEGFNNRAKLIKRQAYGYRSFENYRLRLLNACH